MLYIFSNGFRSTALLILAAVVGGLVFVFWFGQSSYQVAGTTLEAKIFPSKQGITRITVPPLGEMRAQTHKVPFGISISIERVTMTQVRRLASADVSQGELINEAEKGLGEASRDFAVRLLILAALGGLMAGLILPGRSWKRAIIALLIGMLALAIPGLMIIKTYDVKAWRQPKFTGMLTAAPWLIGTLEDKMSDLDAFRTEMRGLAGNLYQFYDKVSSWEPVELGNGTLKVLHVSDIHNNPAAMDLIEQVVRDFHVDLIIDTGDLTDLGTPIEADLIGRVAKLKIPYVFVPGNHDSESVLETLRSQENVTIIDNNVVKIEGLKIFGASEPVAHEFNAEPATGEKLNEFTNQVFKRFQALKSEPDIVAIHSIAHAQKLVGSASLILTGHTHKPSLKVEGGTVIDDVGTTGAAGVRHFREEEGMPYSLKLLYFTEKSKNLIAVDSLALSGVSRDFILERRLMEQEQKETKNSSATGNLNVSWRTRKSETPAKRSVK